MALMSGTSLVSLLFMHRRILEGAASDFIVVGGGIAGVSAAAFLSEHGSVHILEKEPVLSYHTTGRSAALFTIYGASGLRPLAIASRHFLESPPQHTGDSPLLSNRGMVRVANASQEADLESIASAAQASGAAYTVLNTAELLLLVPVLKPSAAVKGLFDPDAREIDVSALHQTFVRIARANGASITTSCEMASAERHSNRWSVTTSDGKEFSCGALINAAGAWGDEVARLAGVQPVGLQPMRRTAFTVPGHKDLADLPMVLDAKERFYFKPDGGQFLCSLAEESPSVPADVSPRMEDVAIAIERINEATTLNIRSVRSQWVGLRTFSPDRNLVVGEEPTASGFYWLVGQGGTGIATAPAYGRLLESCVVGDGQPADLMSAGVHFDRLHPSRFRN